MSTYDDALSLIESEVNRDCDYYVYSQLRDAVDGMEMEGKKPSFADRLMSAIWKLIGR